MRSIMLDISRALHGQAEKRGQNLVDAANRMGPHLARAAPEDIQAAEERGQSVELKRLQGALDKLTDETGKIKQENQTHLAELATIRTDVENLRKENTRLGLETLQEKSGREALQTDKAKLEAQIEQLKQQLQQRDEKVLEAEQEARRYRNEVDLARPTIDRLREIIQVGEKERKKIKIRLDAVKLLVLQDDLGDLSTLDIKGPPPVENDVMTRIVQEGPSLTPNSILPRPTPSRETSVPPTVDPGAAPATTWSKSIKERAKSIESVKLLKVAWKLAAMERIVLPFPPSTPGTSGTASAAASSPAGSVKGAASSANGEVQTSIPKGTSDQTTKNNASSEEALSSSSTPAINGAKSEESNGKDKASKKKERVPSGSPTERVSNL